MGGGCGSVCVTVCKSADVIIRRIDVPTFPSLC